MVAIHAQLIEGFAMQPAADDLCFIGLSTPNAFHIYFAHDEQSLHLPTQHLKFVIIITSPLRQVLLCYIHGQVVIWYIFRIRNLASPGK
jgi:hypothetical protein